MSLAEEMLATMPLSDDSSTYSADEEPHIVINESRQAIVPNELKTIAVTGDKDIETVTFDCVRYWDGNDLSTFAIYLNYVLPDLTTGTYIPEKITTTDGDEFYHFDWQIKNNITAKSGKISFAVTAISTKPNWAGNPIVDKQWSSLPNSDCSIALGIDVSNVPSEEESSAVLAQMSAILEQIQTDFDDWLKNSVVQTTGDSTTAVMSQRATTEEFDMLKARLKLYDAAYGIIVTGLEKTYYIAMRNSKQIDNLKSGISDQFETDSSIAYVKDVPSNAMPYAEVKKIGGMTYKDGNTLKSAKVTEVKSVGANLMLPLVEGTFFGVTFKKDANGVYHLSGTATTDIVRQYVVNLPKREYSLTLNHSKTVGTQTNNSMYIVGRNASNGWLIASYAFLSNTPSIADVEIHNILFVIHKGVNVDGVTIAPMLNAGSTAKPHTPYVEHTLPIPEAVRPANGINENVYDYIEWAEDGRVNQGVRCGVVDLGTLDWYTMYDEFFYTVLNGKAFGLRNFIIENGEVASSYTGSWDDNFPNGTWGGDATDAMISYRMMQGEYTDAAAFKAAMSGVMLVYELAEPIITDISNLITADNLIGVEGGGTLTFENEYGYAVPSEVEYQVEV